MCKKLLFIFLVFWGSLQSEEIDLSRYEQSIYSQNGEDGVLAKIFMLLNQSSGFCVEFGADDGVRGSNTYLFRLGGWDCLLLDRLSENPHYNLYKAFITAENINELFYEYQVPYNLDLLSIDIDYNDFYVWQAIDEKYRPSVVVIEYNATHLPHEDKVVKYRPFFCSDGSNYFGASILAMYQLGRSKGYSLVYAEKTGTNLFFVRDDFLKEKNLEFTNMNNVEKLYRHPKYGNGPNGGHRQDPRNREYLSSCELLKQK